MKHQTIEYFEQLQSKNNASGFFSDLTLEQLVAVDAYKKHLETGTFQIKSTFVNSELLKVLSEGGVSRIILKRKYNFSNAKTALIQNGWKSDDGIEFTKIQVA